MATLCSSIFPSINDNYLSCLKSIETGQPCNNCCNYPCCTLDWDRIKQRGNVNTERYIKYAGSVVFSTIKNPGFWLCTTAPMDTINGPTTILNSAHVQNFINDIYVVVSFISYTINTSDSNCALLAYNTLTRTLGLNGDLTASIDSFIEGFGENYLYTIGMAYLPMFILMAVLCMALLMKGLLQVYEFIILLLIFAFVLIVFGTVFSLYVKQSVEDKKTLVKLANNTLRNFFSNLPTALSISVTELLNCELSL